MRTPLVSALVALAPLLAHAAGGPGASGLPPTSCDTRIDVDVRKKADLGALAPKIAAAAKKLRATAEVDVGLRGRGLDAAALAALGHDPALAGIGTLRVPCLGVAAWRSLLAPGVFPGLTTLAMTGCRVDETAAGALGGLAARDAIVKLDLGRGKTSAATLKTLLGLERHAPLTVVVSDLHSVSTAALADLGRLAPNPAVTFSVAVRCPDLARLDRTGFLKHVSRVAIACGDSGAKLLARSTNAGALRSITIDACAGDDDDGGDDPLTREAALALVEAPTLAGVVELGFHNNLEVCEQSGIGRAGLADILSAPFAPRLRSLELAQQALGPKGVALLVSTERLPALRRLVIEKERLSEADVRALVQSGPLAGRLAELALPGADSEEAGDLDDKTAGTLAAALTMPALRRLDLTMNPLSRATKDRLRSAPWATELELLDVGASGEGRSCPVTWHRPDVAPDPE